MEQGQFELTRSAIDKEIDTLPDRPTGIKMGFGLAGAFMIRSLLETVVVDMVHWRWEMRAYRGRYVYPDPMMDEFDYVIGNAD